MPLLSLPRAPARNVDVPEKQSINETRLIARNIQEKFQKSNQKNIHLINFKKNVLMIETSFQMFFLEKHIVTQ